MMLIHQVKDDVWKLARLAASVAEAHTAAVFLPTGFLPTGRIASASPGNSSNFQGYTFASQANHDALPLTHVAGFAADRRPEQSANRLSSIELIAAYSHSNCLVRDSRIPVGAGLIGWVAENQRPIHVAPFDMDSSTLGIYSDSEEIRGLLAVPIAVTNESGENQKSIGVLVCDSKQAVSFSKQQIKQVEEIAQLISRVIFWSIVRHETAGAEMTWQSFTYRAGQLADAIGAESVEVLRLGIQNFAQLEAAIGISAAVQHSDQFMRLIQQALPPHFPVIRLPNGEILIALDNMMSGFFQQKIRSLAARPTVTHRKDTTESDQANTGFAISIVSYCTKQMRLKVFDLDTVLNQTPGAATVASPVITSKVVGGSRA